jgi:hypothetical protein
MNNRHVRKMLRQMTSGGPVRVGPVMGTTRRYAELAFIAQQFGYEYADLVTGGGSRSREHVMLLVPDSSPQAQARAARNWAEYPNAADGGVLPPLAPEAVELLYARITFDVTSRADTGKVVAAALGFTAVAAALGFRLGNDTTAWVVAGSIWVALAGILLPALLINSRRLTAKYVATLRAAGYTPVTDQRGRLRYLPPASG